MPRTRFDAIPGFTEVAPTIWEQNPVFDPSAISIGDPSLIILCSWTGALGRHVAKYTTTYRTLFPTTPILVVTTTAKDLCFRSSAKKQLRLRPAVDRILAYDHHAGVLMHCFSEGGSNKAAELAEAYHATTGDRLPCTALCLDSTPGHPRYLRLCKALGKSLPPNPVLHSMGLALGSAVLGGIWLLYACCKGRDNNVISKTRRRIVDPKLWDLSMPRCYFYSKADKLIAWQDVQAHMADAEDLGVPVVDVCFEKSAHCKHAAEDVDRYWSNVIWTWSKVDREARTASKTSELAQQEKDEPDGRVKSDGDSERTLWLNGDDAGRVGNAP